jgi:carbon-monoxide dehydrogenase small subunit
MKITFRLNGTERTVDVDPVARLLDVLRGECALTGTKEGCGEGECGACSVLINGALANSCLVPIQQIVGADVTTIEGVRETAAGVRLIEAFSEAHAAQCGFCTPGMVLASLELLRRVPEPDESTIRHGISGNICRCTGYDMIVDGVILAGQRAAEENESW